MPRFEDLIREEEIKEETKENVKIVPKEIESFSVLKFFSVFLVVALIGLFGLFFYLKDYIPNSQGFIISILLIGSSLFLPFGVFIGKFFLDQKSRGLMLRKLTKKNIGLINFVSKGRRIKSILRNIDDDIVWIGSKLWHISGDNIYWYSENESTKKVDLDPKMIYDSNGLPTIYFDLDSITPLDFAGNKTIIKPEELGSTVKSYIYNQALKQLLVKRTLQIFILGALLASAGALVLSFLTWDLVNNQVIDQLTAIQNTISPVITGAT